MGTVVYAGVDYAEIVARAGEEGDVLLWDGGDNDFPFVRPDLHIVLVNPLRAGDERNYHPGEAVLVWFLPVGRGFGLVSGLMSGVGPLLAPFYRAYGLRKGA